MGQKKQTSGIAGLEGHGGGAGVPTPRNRWKTRVLLPAAVMVCGAGLLLYTGREALRPALGVEVVPVVTKVRAVGPAEGVPEVADQSQGGSGAVAAQAPGWIEPDPYAVNVAALANGVVREVMVLEGERVSEGQVVARLVDDDALLAMTRAEAEVQERRAEMVAANADLHKAKTEWDNPVEETRAVAVAEATLAEMKAELARQPLEIEAAAAKLDELRDELGRKGALEETRAIAAGEIVRLRMQERALAAALEAARGMTPVLEARVRAGEAELVAAKDNLRLRQRHTQELARSYAMVESTKAAMEVAQAKRDEARLRLTRMEVVSPAAGVVMSRHVEPGSKVMMEMDSPSSSWIVRIYDPAKLQVRVDVPLVSAALVGVGQEAEVTVEALPDRVFKGRVTRLVHEANIQKNTVQVKVAIEDPAPELRPEMLARVRLFAGRSGGKTSGGSAAPTGSGVVMAPSAVLMKGEGGAARAWVVDQARSEARLREVRLGSRVDQVDGEWVEVTEGLRPGDRLIAGDTSGLRDGVRVRIDGEMRGGEHGVH